MFCSVALASCTVVTAGLLSREIFSDNWSLHIRAAGDCINNYRHIHTEELCDFLLTVIKSCNRAVFPVLLMEMYEFAERYR